MVRDCIKTLSESGIMLSNHFSVAELFRSSSAVLAGLDNHPNSYTQLTIVLRNLKEVCKVLEVIRSAMPEVQPIIVNSGYRSEQVNKLVKGISGSRHKLGAAVDITANDFDMLAETVEWLNLKNVYMIVYHKKRYIHLELKKPELLKSYPKNV